MNLRKLLGAAIAVVVSFSAGAVPADDNQQFFFQGEKSIAGWGKTTTLTLNPQADCLEMEGNGWDSKIYRSINLPAGNYRMTACGKGKVIAVRLFQDKTQAANLNISGSDWRTDYLDFTLAKGGALSLLVHLESPGKVQSAIKFIKIENNLKTEEKDIALDELKAHRPSPAIVRGCTMPQGKDAADLRGWGANVVRKWIALKPDRYDKNGLGIYDSGWEKKLEDTEKYLIAVRAAGMTAILTIGSNAFANKTDAWKEPDFGPVMCKVWQGIATRLLPYRDVIWGYDLYNEPLDWTQMPNAPRQWRGIAIEVIKAIRTVDPEVWIVFENGPGGGTRGLTKPLPDARVVYSIHCYSPAEFTHQGISNIANTDLAEAKLKTGIKYPSVVNGVLYDKEQIKKELAVIRAFQLKYQVPIILGEFSVIRWAPKEDAVQYLKDMTDIAESYQWSWCYHGFREWHGWSAEHDETFAVHDSAPKPAAYETERAKVIKTSLQKNLQP